MADVLREPVWAAATQQHSTNNWLAQFGGQYLKAVRLATGTEVETAAKRWTDEWAIPISADQWTALESHGKLPTQWAQKLDRQLFDRLPGSWIWGILRAAGDFPDNGLYSDLIMVTFLMGRLRRVRCKALGAEQDYETLAKAVPTSNPTDLANWGRSFRAQVGWTIPPSHFAKPSAFPTKKKPIENLTADEQELIRRYRILSPADRSAVNHIITRLLTSTTPS